MNQKFADGSRVCLKRDDRISRDLWHKMGTVEKFHQPCPPGDFSRGGSWLYVIKLDNPKRDGSPDMPIVQCEEWAIE